DARTGAEILTLRHDNVVFSASFSLDGSRVVTACKLKATEAVGDKTATVWDARTGAQLLTLSGHRLAVFSPDGARIVTASRDDRTAKVWDAATGAELLTLRGTGLRSSQRRRRSARTGRES